MSNLDTAPNEEPKLTDHAYDGIQEYDNPLPGWWSALFTLTIIFTPMYLLYYHGGGEGESVYESYDKQRAQIFQRKFKELGDLTPDRTTLLTYMNDPEWLTVGKSVFQANCVSCHGKDGEGVVGPNLTDDYFKHVNTIEDIAKVISDGAANGAMPAWRNRLSHVNQIVLTAAYVASLRGTGASGKGPEGKEISAWDAPPAAK